MGRLAATLLGTYASWRRRALEATWRDPLAVQERTLLRLVGAAWQTAFGRAHDFERVRSVAGYQERAPLRDYLDFRPLWERALAGEADVTWPGRPRYWARTSGTTAGDKLIPVTAEAFASHRRGGWDTLVMACGHAGAARLLGGPMLFLGGSTTLEPVGQDCLAGDLSGLVVRRLPPGFRGRYSPGAAIAAIPDWETRLAAVAELAAGQDLGHPRPRRHSVAEVQLDRAYAVVLTTGAGLWSYRLGDTVRFIARDPLRLVVAGRTRHFVNAFGENVIVEEVEQALVAACRRAHATVVEFTVAPRVPSSADPRGGHEWLVEFDGPPRAGLGVFARALDETLLGLNTDYRTKRTADVGMTAPRVLELPAGTFHRWLREHGKLGDQHKVPRVTNDRSVAEELLRAAGSRAAQALVEVS
jgi:hypothetical protein